MMICPHCEADLLYKERRGRQCSKCRQKFALDPKENPLRLHDLRFRHLIDRLSLGGTLHYTLPQLLHVASQKTVQEAKPQTGCMIGAIVITVFASIVFWSVVEPPLPLFIGFLALFLLFIIWGWTRDYDARKPWGYLKLPIMPAQFRSLILRSWQRVYGETPAGLVDEAALPAIQERQPAAENLRAVLVCPAPDVLLCLQANDIPVRFGLGLLSTRPNGFNEAEKSTLATLQANPQIPLFFLHSANLLGMLMIKGIRQSFGLSEEHPVIDLGLFPRQVLENNLMTLAEPPKADQVKAIKADQSLNLSSEEIEWLENGYYSPILAIKPARLIKIITRALNHDQTDFELVEENPPEEQAESIGFMTWPTR